MTVSPALYKEILHREKYAYVTEKVGWGSIENNLVNRFFFGTRSFLERTLDDFSASSEDWHDSLHSVFHNALELSGQLLLLNQEVKILWPVFDETMDAKLMFIDAEPTGRFHGKVRATIFPGVTTKASTRKDGSESVRGEHLVFRSLILLQ